MVRKAVVVIAVRRLPHAALLLAPAVALVALAFDAGGYYAGTTAMAALAALGALVTWMLLAPNALAGLGRSGAIVLALLAGFAGWTLLSGVWSHAPGVALIEFDRGLLYVAVFALFACAGRAGVRARALVAILAGAALVVAVIGLAAWLLPHQFPVSATFERRRMSYPTGYWNVTGLIAGLGVVWSLHLASASREHWALRVAGAAAIPPLVAVIGFTASRGAVLATVAGAIVYVLATRSRAVVVGLLAGLPGAVASSVVVSRTPDLAVLSSGVAPPVFSPEAIVQGQRGAVALVLCSAGAAIFRALLLALDRHLVGISIHVPSRRTRLRALSAALALFVAVGIASGVSGLLSHAYQRFSGSPESVPPGANRLTSLSSDGRVQLWHVALTDAFAPDPLRGSGAGTFAALWNRHRPSPPTDALLAASLYIGTLGDLGIVGAGLLFGALLAIVLALVRRTRQGGAEGGAWAGLLGAAATWLVFAAVDWSWQMPASTIWLLAVAGLALSRPVDREGRPPARARGRFPVTGSIRIVIVGIAGALALVPYALERSDSSLARAIVDLQRNDCTGAASQASASRDAVAQRSEPYMVLAYCAVRGARNTAALAYAAAAVQRDPDNWEAYYAQGLVQAAAGEQPAGSLRAALLRDPLGNYAIAAATSLDRASPSAWRRIALGLPIPLAVTLCGGPTRAVEVAPCGNPPLPTLGAGSPVKTLRP